MDMPLTEIIYIYDTIKLYNIGNNVLEGYGRLCFTVNNKHISYVLNESDVVSMLSTPPTFVLIEFGSY